MNNKAIILLKDDATLENGIQEYFFYAIHKNYDLSGAMQYDEIMLFKDPARILKDICDLEEDILLVDDTFVMADVYHKGKIANYLHEHGKDPIFRELDISLIDADYGVSEERLVGYQKRIDMLLEGKEILEKVNRCLIITNDKNKEQAIEFKKKVEENNSYNKVFIGLFSKFDAHTKRDIESMIEDVYIKTIIIFDEDYKKKGVHNYLKNLKEQFDINVFTKEDLEMKMQQQEHTNSIKAIEMITG